VSCIYWPDTAAGLKSPACEQAGRPDFSLAGSGSSIWHATSICLGLPAGPE
jgi:hypothetical protein